MTDYEDWRPEFDSKAERTVFLLFTFLFTPVVVALAPVDSVKHLAANLRSDPADRAFALLAIGGVCFYAGLSIALVLYGPSVADAIGSATVRILKTVFGEIMQTILIVPPWVYVAVGLGTAATCCLASLAILWRDGRAGQ